MGTEVQVPVRLGEGEQPVIFGLVALASLVAIDYATPSAADSARALRAQGAHGAMSASSYTGDLSGGGSSALTGIDLLDSKLEEMDQFMDEHGDTITDIAGYMNTPIETSTGIVETVFLPLLNLF